MAQTLAVFGATGTQGGSVINFVLSNQNLTKMYKIRAITRNVGSEKAKLLASRNVEVVEGDMDRKDSILLALRGADTVFVVTTPMTQTSFDTIDDEYNSAKRIADAAVEVGSRYIIYSTLPGVTELTGGKFSHAAPFDAKAKAQKYIAALPIRSAFVSLASFMENFETQAFMGPQKALDGRYYMARNIGPKARIPLIAAASDTGKFVGAILLRPERHAGKTFKAADRLYTMEEICAALSKSAGKEIIHQ